MYNFNFKNIIKHPKSSFFGLAIGVVISGILFTLVAKKYASLSEAMPVLVIIVPFLLYGKKEQQ